MGQRTLSLGLSVRRASGGVSSQGRRLGGGLGTSEAHSDTTLVRGLGYVRRWSSSVASGATQPKSEKVAKCPWMSKTNPMRFVQPTSQIFPTTPCFTFPVAGGIGLLPRRPPRGPSYFKVHFQEPGGGGGSSGGSGGSGWSFDPSDIPWRPILIALGVLAFLFIAKKLRDIYRIAYWKGEDTSPIALLAGLLAYFKSIFEKAIDAILDLWPWREKKIEEPEEEEPEVKRKGYTLFGSLFLLLVAAVRLLLLEDGEEGGETKPAGETATASASAGNTATGAAAHAQDAVLNGRPQRPETRVPPLPTLPPPSGAGK